MFLLKLADLVATRKQPVERLVQAFPLSEINSAVAVAHDATTVKPVLIPDAEGRSGMPSHDLLDPQAVEILRLTADGPRLDSQPVERSRRATCRRHRARGAICAHGGGRDVTLPGPAGPVPSRAYRARVRPRSPAAV